MANPNDMNLEGDKPSTDSTDVTSDAGFAKHLDMAIEAQDGPTVIPPNTETKTGEEAKSEGDKQPKTGEKSSTGDPKDSATQQPTNKEAAKDTKTTRGPKDLTDGQGNVIAAAGKERRFYEQAQTARQEAQHVTRERDTLRNQLHEAQNKLRTTEETVQQVQGMAPAQVAVATRMFTDLQRDPVSTLQKLLAEAVAAGHTIEGIGAGIDTQAITRLIDQRMAPLSTQTDTVNEAELVRQVEEEAGQFFNSYPDAKIHDPLIARVIADHPGMDLPTVYFQLKNSFAERGYDWSQTLEDNMAHTTDPSTSVSTTTAQQKPSVAIPNGRPTTEATAIADTPVAHENTDMGDIVRQAMRENGLKV